MLLVHVDKPPQIASASVTMCRFCPYSHICARNSVERLASDLLHDAYAQQLTGALERGHVQQTIQPILSNAKRSGLPTIERRCLYGAIAERLQSVPLRNYLCNIYKD